MKRPLLLASLALFCLSTFGGCAAVFVNAPPGHDIRLMSEEDPSRVRIVKHNWYILWGLVPLNSNRVEDNIDQHSLKAVRVSTYYGVVDWIIDVLLSWTSIHTRTVVIDGQR